MSTTRIPDNALIGYPHNGWAGTPRATPTHATWRECLIDRGPTPDRRRLALPGGYASPKPHPADKRLIFRLRAGDNFRPIAQAARREEQQRITRPVHFVMDLGVRALEDRHRLS